MSRESFQQTQIPTSIESIPYLDPLTLAQGMFKHAASFHMGTVTGAGGVGGTLEGVPFEPAIIVCLNPAGVAPAVHISTFGDAADHVSIILATAANATPPVITGSANDWDVALPIGMAPDAEVLTVICIGFAALGSE